MFGNTNKHTRPDFFAVMESDYGFKSTVMRALRYRDLLLENRALADKLREQAGSEGNPE